MAHEKQTWKLFYDSSCNLCHASMKKLRKWAADAGQPLEVHTLHGPEAQEKGYKDQMILEADGNVYRAGDAWLRSMTIAPWYLRWISWFRFTSVTATLAKFFYNFIATNRHRFFGRRDPNVKCAPDAG